ncbi:MAG: hypothetical protein ACXWC9_02325 [Pseudobdellovibrionaceae bacterium]
MKTISLALIAVLTLAASTSSAFTISRNNQIALDQANRRLALAQSLHGQSEKGLVCEVLVSDEALGILRPDGYGASVDFSDYDFTVKKKKRHLQMFAPTSDGHNELSIKEIFAERKLVVTMLNEFRGLEAQEICILNTKR